MTDFPEPEGGTPGGFKLLCLGLLAYSVSVAAITVRLLAHMHGCA